MNQTSAIPRVDLTAFRERVGLSVRELARQLDTSHTNIINWEKSGRVTKTEFIAPLSSILGVTLEELLGLPKVRQGPPAGGRLGQLFRDVSGLPRRKQERIVDVVEALVAQQVVKS